MHLKASPPPRPRARPGTASAERFEHGFETAHGSGRAGPVSRAQLLP